MTSPDPTTEDGDEPVLESEIIDLGFAAAAPDANQLVVDVEGYEGPLDLLLALARAQKVDITRISILELAEQYLEFIREVRSLRLELAADYLVMAAWLAFLKSRLLLPQEDDEDEPSGKELAARLAFRLQRLQAMRNVSATLMARNQLGREVFARGAPEGIHVVKTSEYTATLYDLLSAYAARRAINAARYVRFKKLPVVTVTEARSRLERLVGGLGDWQALDALLAAYLVDPDLQPSIVASSFTATLELVREGQIELRQAQHYDPLFVRRRKAVTAVDSS